MWNFALPFPVLGAPMKANGPLSVDPAQRGWASSEANFSAPVALDGPMRALAVGVVDASRCDEVAEGEYLYGWFDWQDFAIAEPSAIILRADLPLPRAQFGGLVGINGLTAYLALTKCGRPTEGDKMLVSTAAGGVGSLVGQIGRILGCQCFGLAGSDDKVALCADEYGYDKAWNYKTADLDAVLSESVPGGLNIYFDNVGGTILDQALRHLAVGARVVQCGTASVPS
ncbi:NADP-dependent oxidoreductase [Paracoccus sp. J55]|uniref:MDR family NADP-dependent oxidoreductase n=1 Tax=Paracoccus sp. J55 TaxID=935849 RepID=UPI0004B8219C|nr:NADP-dependent oxidoreductase [Paracoccus sp. J55]